MDTFEEAKDWYQHRATNLEIAGVRIRLFKNYPDLKDEKEAFLMAAKDELAKKPL